MTELIKLKNVSFQYYGSEDKKGVKNINLNINPGECILLCGESGCGKTTLTRLINGLIPNYYEGELSGDILVNNMEIKDKELYEIASIVGSVFQNPKSQFFNGNTTNELAFICENLGMDEEEIRQRIKKVSKEFSIEKLLNKSVFNLSGGEKQKIACASVAVPDLDILVLDEPSSNLDYMGIRELRRIIKLWKDKGKTIIIAEHRLHYLNGLADRIIYMKKGQVDKEFTHTEFLELSDNKRKNMGLRAFEMNKINADEDLTVEFSDKNIYLKDFIFSYSSSKKILNIDNLALPQGGIVAVVGNNGAGKSTLAKCICGIHKKCGKIKIDKRELKWRKRLNSCYMVMQDVNHQLFTENVLDEVLLSMDNEDIKKAEEVLASLDIIDVKERHPVSLSGGQKQRTAIATSILSNREIIVFDEPTSGLDYKHMLEVSHCLKELSKEVKMIIVITHDPEFVLNCCNYIIELEDGVIKENFKLDLENSKRLVDYFNN